MNTKIKSEWKTYEEMNHYEQLEFRIYDGWKTYTKRLKSISKYGQRTYEYLIETWKKDGNN